MPRNITITFADGSTHVYQNAPDNVTPDAVAARAQKDFGKQVKALDGGRGAAHDRQSQRAQPAPKPTPRPSMGNSALNSLAAVGGAMWRGASSLPDMAADFGDAVTGTVANALGFNMPQQGKPFRMADVPDRLGTPRPVAPGVELAGQLLGGMATPIPTPAKKPGISGPIRQPAPRPTVSPARRAAREVVAAGKQAGVRVLTTDVKPPKTFVGKIAQATGERIIGTGTGGVRAAQQGERIAAVKQVLSDFGAIGADDAADAVAADLAKTRGAELSRLSTAKNSVIQGVQGAVPMPQTAKAIDEQIARLTGINADAFAPVIAKLNEFKAQLASGKTLDQIEGNRRLLGDLFKDPSLAAIAGDGQKALNAVYAPLRADMGNFIRAKAGDAAFAKWKGANDRLAAMAGELSDGTFKRVLSTAEATPENVARMLFSKKPSDVARLYSNLSAEGRAKAQAAVLHQAMQKAGGLDALSPDKFVNQIEALGRTAGVHFQAADLTRLEGLTRVLNATQRAATAAVAPPTGVQTAVAAVYGGAGATGGLPALLGVQGYGLIARAYESAPVRNALLRLGRTKAGSPQELTELNRVITSLSLVAERHTAELGRVANDPVGIPAAAGDRQEN